MLLSWRRVCAEDGQINRAAVEIFICLCWLEGMRLGGGGGFEPEWHCCQICQRWKSATPPVVLLARTSFAVVANFFRQPFGPEPSLLFGAVKKRAQIL